MNSLLDPPCKWCGYNGQGYWQIGTHDQRCAWHNVGGADKRDAELSEFTTMPLRGEGNQSKDNWISVEDRLPVKVKNHNYFRCIVNVNGFGVRVDRFIFQTDENKVKDHWYDYYGCVTHWQPLPEPPKDNQ